MQLNAVSQEILGETKVDLKPQEMFIKFKQTDADRMDIGRYCVQVVSVNILTTDCIALTILVCTQGRDKR